ncbi:ATP-dependent DNA ligase, partial [Streptomyces rhizosphaericus]|uniref:ATP-dependent DNA ligase n=1 Tax=Streptomyces rhizosphaericus TaxID=114699 RepID=UPI003F882C78
MLFDNNSHVQLQRPETSRDIPPLFVDPVDPGDVAVAPGRGVLSRPFFKRASQAFFLSLSDVPDFYPNCMFFKRESMLRGRYFLKGVGVMKVMKPIASSEIPTGEDWLYEVKYDGFRCVLHWEKDTIRLTSKNAKNLSDSFPEVVEFCLQQSPSVANFLPLTLDGELVVLN